MDSYPLDEVPMMTCFKCGAAFEDHDGFGLLHCTSCGWCCHPARDLIDGQWVCGLCGDKRQGSSE